VAMLAVTVVMTVAIAVMNEVIAGFCTIDAR
jgi:hypothetical protein